MKRLLALLAIAASLTAAGPAQAGIMLGFQPASSTAIVGESLNVDLWIYGLGDGGAPAAPALGGFDLDVGFDPAVLEFNAVTFGLGLDVSGLGTGNGFDDSVSGTVNLFEFSLDTVADLNALQLDSFVLATLSFDALASGSSTLTISDIVLGDALGDPITADDIGSATVIVSQATVPEPASLALLAAALLALVAATRRRR